jgi:hypothetical protein
LPFDKLRVSGGQMENKRETGNRLLEVKVRPNAARSEVTGCSGGALQVKIAAPPEKGKANRELIDFLSKALGVKKSSVLIVKGGVSRNKLISVEGLSPEEIIKKLTG